MRKLHLLATTLRVAAPFALPLLPLAAAPLAVLALPGTAMAQTVTGPYVSLGAGYNILQDEYLRTDPAISEIPSGRSIDPVTGERGTGTRYKFGDGFNGQGSIGYGLGNGLRVEIEGDYYQNEINERSGSPSAGSSSGHQESYGAMGNVLYDLDLTSFGIPTFGVTPYIGAGAGYQWGHLSPITTINNDGTLDRVGGTNGSFAFQGIVGVSYPISSVPGLSLTAEYRYMEALNNDAFSGEHFQPYGVNKGNIRLSAAENHSVMLGMRYALWQPAPPPPPAAVPPPPAAPAPEPARTYLVFFDWDRADLTSRAREIIAQAAQASTHVQTTRIEVNGYTDLSGTAAYNQKLSVRRAQSVESELVRDGVAENEISIHGYGESNPLVPTAPGVREPQNRRVEIILH
jgi:outer membrane protein OmpA-like peptidoglycan-associated protein